MNQAKWQDIKQEIYDNATVQDSGIETDEEGAEIEFVEFERDNKTYRFECIKRPKIINTKSVYSHRSGAVGTEQHEYDSEQKTYAVKSYVLDEEESVWEEL